MMPHNDVMEYLQSLAPLFDKEIERTVPRNRTPQEVYGVIWDLLDRGGKRFRPAMCMLSAEAVGGDGKKTIPAGAAIEMFHSFTLMHDDIEDNSDMRRGKPCVHKIYGIPLAINAGDGLFMMVWEELLSLKFPTETLLGAQKTLATAFRRVLEGQAIELEWYRKGRFDMGEQEFFSMVEGKTGALIAASCEVGAYLAGGKPDQLAALGKFGMAVGVAFQVQDDVLNLLGKEETYGKEIGGDMSEGKRSLITIHALANAPPAERKRLVEILSARTKDQKQVREAIEICRRSGSIDYAAETAKRLVDDAKKGLMILPNNAASRRLLQLADFFIYREM